MNITSATDRSPAACAQEQLDAYNQRNIMAFASVYAPTVQLIDLAQGTVFCDGREALIDRYGLMFESHPLLHCELRSRIVAPPFVIDEELVTGLADHPIHAVATYLVEDGFIQRAWFLKEQA